MKVLFCITRSDTLGGAQIHVADMAAWLQFHGHEVVIIVGGEGPFTRHLDSKGVAYENCRYLCRPIRPLRDVFATAALRRRFRQLAPDVIALHSAKAGLLGRFAAIGLGIPVVFTAHGWPFTEGVSARRAVVFRTLERIVSPLADRIIAVSNYDKSLATAARVAPEDKIVAIQNAMPDLVESAPMVRDSPTSVRLIMVARQDAQKDHVTLLSALVGLPSRNWTLDLVGDGPLEQSLRARVEALGLSDRVRFLGLRDDVAELLGQSDIFILASNWEGLPLTILEAMRAGLSVVASAVGGIPECVDDGRTGYVVPPGDVGALRARLQHLIGDSEARRRFGQAGRHRFEAQFRFERMAEETLGVYEQVVEKKAAVVGS